MTIMMPTRSSSSFFGLCITLILATTCVEAYSIPRVSGTPRITYRSAESAVTSMSMSNEDSPEPTTFREAELIGLRLMQESRCDEALKMFKIGMKLPGSRPDVIRSRSSRGPSPVGGSFGGTDSQNVKNLDDYELQALYYNMACANSRLGNIAEAVINLEKAFNSGFNNYSTCRGDPDLDAIKESRDFKKLMETYDPKSGGFNPFGLFNQK